MIKDLNVDHMKINLKPSFYRSIEESVLLNKANQIGRNIVQCFRVVNIAVIYDVPLVVLGEDIAFEFGSAKDKKVLQARWKLIEAI